MIDSTTHPYVQPAATSGDRNLFWWLAIPTLILDQLSKQWILDNVPLNTVHVPVPALYPYFKFTHIGNTGAVFGTIQNAGVILSILAVAVGIGLIWYNYQLPIRSRKYRTALGLVFGGAIGNLIDRFRVGHVIDFVDLDFSSIIPHRLADWYIWNIADLAIVSAVIVMMLLIVFDPDQVEPRPLIEEKEIPVPDFDNDFLKSAASTRPRQAESTQDSYHATND